MRYLICIIFVTLSGFCFSQNNLSLLSANGQTFRVIIKGKVYNEKPQAHVVLEKITNDTLQAELEFENKKKFPATIYLLERGISCKNKEFNYRVECNNQRLNLHFMGIYDILALRNPLVPVKPVIDTSAKYNNNVLDHFCELKNGKPLYFNNLPKTGRCLKEMPPKYLEYVAFLISRAEVEDHKFTIIENVCRNNCLSVFQLSTLLNYIAYEIEKLKIIRLAYPSITDPVNKKNLEKNFRFESSLAELKALLKTVEESKVPLTSNCVKAASQMLIDNYAERLGNFSNDGERYEAFKKGYADLCYTTGQVMQILNKFIHDREKLDAAKLLYFNCVEKDTYLKIGEVFSYNQTTSELKDFIDKQK